MIRVFVSVGMSGRNEEDIREDIRRSEKILKEIMEETDFEIVHNYDCVTPKDKEVGRLYYLGNAIVKMDECDLIFFTKGYEQHKGCLIEEYIAKLYQKDVVYENMCDLEDANENIMQLRCDNAESVLSRYHCELTDELDEFLKFDKNSVLHHYIVINEYALDDKCLLIRIPGSTVGCIYFDTDKIITDICVKPSAIYQYPYSTNDNLNKYIGKQLKF